MTAYEDPLVSAEWLKTYISAPDVRIVDASWFVPWVQNDITAHEAWKREHIPRSVFFDIDEIADSNSPYPHMMPDAVKFSSRMRKLGIGDGNRVIVYDRNKYCASARAWWMLRVMGHTDVKVLDGGLNAWKEAGGEIDDLPTPPGERHFTPRVRSDLLMEARALEQLVGAGKVRIIDSRPADRFEGRLPEPREGLPAGHIPGSVNIPMNLVFNADSRMKTAADLAEVLPNTRELTVTTCGSGVAACVTALAYARLGNWDVAVFDGSWTEWASDPRRPIAKGAE